MRRVEDNKKTAAAVTATTNESKDYTETFENGTTVKFSFTTEIENYSPDDFQELLACFAKYSHNFYLFMGREIIKK